MEPLETTFTKYAYRYEQVERQGDVAIFRQTHKENAAVVRFEVVKVHIQPEHVWPNGTMTPEKEAMPGSSSWGRDGWTCWDLPQAQALMAALQTKVA